MDAPSVDVWNRAEPPAVDVGDQWNQRSPRIGDVRQVQRKEPEYTDEEDDDIMRVSATSPPQAVASSINHAIFEDGILPTIRAIGAGAVAQTCKGIAIARGHVAVRGHDLGVAIGFDNVVSSDGKEISAQTFRLFLMK